MFFNYCIVLQRSADEFWESRPSQIIYCINRYTEMMSESRYYNTPQEGTTEITSMREIAGWGDKV